jgi:hypothetical protein
MRQKAVASIGPRADLADEIAVLDLRWVKRPPALTAQLFE